LEALAAVHDVNSTVAAELSARFDVKARDYEQIIADPSIDALVVAAPAAHHARIAQDGLAAGKHVFVEKPLALNVADAEQLCKTADAAGRVLMVGHLLQYHPAFRALEEAVLEGTLGRLLYLYSNRLNFGRFRQEENILWSFAPHDISMMLRLAQAEPVSVSAVASAPYLHAGIADVTTTHLAFADGLQAHVFVSWLHPYKEQKLVAIGDRGMAVFDDGLPWASKLLLYPHQVDWRNGIPQPAKAEGRPIPVEPDEPLAVECRHFLECCATGSTPRTDGAEGLRVLRVLDSAQQSIAPVAGDHGSPASPKSEYFAHDTACVDEPCEIGAGTRIWHFSHVLAGSRIGRACVIGQNVMIGPDVDVGDRCKIQNNVSLYRGVTLEDGVFCGPSVVFTNVRNPRAEVDRSGNFEPTHVEHGATIGANATIVCGTRLGAFSLVAAGAVVTKDVPPYALVAGVPARRIGWVSAAGERLGDDLVCPRTGRRYQEVGVGHLEELTE